MQRKASRGSGEFTIGSWGPDKIRRFLQEVIKESRYKGHTEDRRWLAEMRRKGLLSMDNDITEKGWKVLDADNRGLRESGLRWLQRTFPQALVQESRDDELYGTFQYDESDPVQAEILENLGWGGAVDFDAAMDKELKRGLTAFGDGLLLVIVELDVDEEDVREAGALLYRGSLYRQVTPDFSLDRHAVSCYKTGMSDAANTEPRRETMNASQKEIIIHLADAVKHGTKNGRDISVLESLAKSLVQEIVRAKRMLMHSSTKKPAP